MEAYYNLWNKFLGEFQYKMDYYQDSVLLLDSLEKDLNSIGISYIEFVHSELLNIVSGILNTKTDFTLRYEITDRLFIIILILDEKVVTIDDKILESYLIWELENGLNHGVIHSLLMYLMEKDFFQFSNYILLLYEKLHNDCKEKTIEMTYECFLKEIENQ